MDAVQLRARVGVLWVTIAVALVSSLLLFMFDPGALEGLLAGEMEGEPLDDSVRIWV
jgi:hypothetical protein